MFDVIEEINIIVLQVTTIIEHVMYLVVWIRNAQLHVTANARQSIAQHEVSKKSQEIYLSIPPNCK